MSSHNQDKHPVELSVVVLCFHSGEMISHFFTALDHSLKTLNVEYEIVLVANDFSDSEDGTADIVKKLARTHPRVCPLTNVKEGMMGWDMLQGMDACTGKYICVIDGDGQFPIESVSMVFSEIKKGNFDIVKTYRVKRYDGLYRFIVSLIYNWTFNWLYPGLHSKDVNSKPRIMPREIYSRLNLQSTGWFIDAEIMIKARHLQLRVKEIPTTFFANGSRKSFVHFGAVLEFAWNLIRYKFKKVP